MTRFEYALSRDEEEEEEEDMCGDARGSLEGVGDMMGLLEKMEPRGEVATFGSRGEREWRRGEEERGEETAGVYG